MKLYTFPLKNDPLLLCPHMMFMTVKRLLKHCDDSSKALMRRDSPQNNNVGCKSGARARAKSERSLEMMEGHDQPPSQG